MELGTVAFQIKNTLFCFFRFVTFVHMDLFHFIHFKILQPTSWEPWCFVEAVNKVGDGAMGTNF